MPCQFTVPDKQPCPAYEDTRSSRGYCFAHEQIYLHDCAVVFRRKRRLEQDAAERWARRQGLSVEAMHEWADRLGEHERPFALKIE